MNYDDTVCFDIKMFILFFQHIFSHAQATQARPFVCPRCDAGFRDQHQLDAHMKFH